MLLLGFLYAGVSSWLGSDTNTARPRSVGSPSRTADVAGIYESVAESECARAFTEPSVRRVIGATGEAGVQLAADNFMTGFRQSGDAPSDERTLAKVHAACERGLREAAGL